ncbi:DNA mismatch repair endonuclease MutL [Aureibacter tunicatorum]|uniref:DNA mismatch repair protein MutL n=1 Tax=Aureibacter tunicatorum TaxID=866807 RepID=A0AAE3XK27_9BACT|nr:DNA mismatch repair endonuclease MutL [Aureibacter tunicatorum]MDR6238083.1 DNA mismatch repair protein MutL [Aureibacter tunicatorum]BDD03116.1 DNA mismatch repair protein MutL [Aureibacter tunicatorum]
MSDIIQLLPDAVANQIAAGEVVQRPSSVVKELLENAIDAGAQNIKLIIKDAGKSLIHVIDDGVGMTENDARMSFERHATSKIKQANDLFTIRTMGFRGEAVASIAAVAQVELKTRQEGDELGLCLKVEASELVDQQPVNCSKGTSFAVKNLFYNVPARRNFLKSNGVELRHIIDEFQRIALAYPEISFSFHNNSNELFKLHKGKLSHRIISIFGKNYKSQLVPCNEEIPHMKLSGYVGKPEFAKKTRGEQFFFVNNRFIKSNYLNHAVMQAYEGLLPTDTFPFYILFIEIDPKHIDINVHPTKTEIKFDDEKTIYSILKATIRQSLGTFSVTPSLDFDSNINFQTNMSTIDFSTLNTSEPELSDDEKKIASHKSYSNFKNIESKSSNSSNWEKMFESSDDDLPAEDFVSIPDTQKIPTPKLDLPTAPTVSTEQKSIKFESAANSLNAFDKNLYANDSDIHQPFQLHNTYIITQVKSGMMLIDQQAAHERILYEKYSSNLVLKSGSSQQFLFPQTIQLNASDLALVQELNEEINALGFVFEIFGNNAVVVNGIPADVAGSDARELFEGLIEQFKLNQSSLSISKQDNMARSMAKRAAVKAQQKMTEAEMKAIIDQLFACANPNYTPKGEPTYYILDMEHLKSFFKK